MIDARPRRRRHSRHRRPSQQTAALPGQTPTENGEGAPLPGLGPFAERCYKHIPRVAIARGKELVQDRRVSDPQRVGDAFTLFVRGSGVSSDVTLDFAQATTAESVLGKCTCPYYHTGGLCKHIWAGILQVDLAGLGESVPGKGPLKVMHENPRAPGERREFRPTVTPGTPATSWISRLDLIQQGQPRERGMRRSAINSQAYFVISAPETINTGKLVLDLWSKDRTLTGEYGQLRPSKYTKHDLSRFEDTQDQEILSILGRTGEPKIFAPFSRVPGAVSSRFIVDPLFESYLLPLLAGAGKILLSRSPNGSPDDLERPLRLDRGNPWEVELRIEVGPNENYKLDGSLRRGEEVRDVRDPLYVFRNGFILFSDRISRLSDARHVAWLTSLRAPQEFLIPKEQGDTLLKRILTHPNSPKLSWPEEIGWSLIATEPRPIGVFRPLGNDAVTGRMTLTVNFDYAGRQVSLDDTSRTIVDLDQKKVYQRNMLFEDKTLRRALEILRDRQGTGTIPSDDMNRAAAELGADGWAVYIENQKLQFTEAFAMNVSSGLDWFDLKMEVSFDGIEVSQDDLLAAIANRSGMVRLKDGNVGMLPPEWLSRFESFSKFGKKMEGGSFRFNKTQGLMLNAVLSDGDHIKADQAFLGLREKVQKFEGVKSVKAPKGFKGELRNYQSEGLSWLGFLEEFEAGGILADDMGLGKTIQILAFLQGRKRKGGKPSLVVAPKSLVFNWLDEAKKFVPDLKFMRYSGAGRGERFEDIKSADVVVTTYGTLRADIEKLEDVEFDLAIADEAQAIKNPASQSAEACKRIQAHQKLALTGTPIENSIQDLFSILDFTSPGLLDVPEGNAMGKDAQSTLAKMLKPFLLRRTKEKVLPELPEKSEQTLYCEMSVKEKKFYSAIREQYRASLQEKIEQGGMGAAKMHILEALLRLRQAACHPGLIDKSLQEEPSAKLSLLLNHIKEVIDEGHKALVFSQFTSLLALVRDALDQEEIVYEYLDGQTSDRKAPVERFQTDPDCCLFLISLKAGGTGLNLTAADYVFILDPWWNPAVEAQAIGRAHRIGQSQKVFAYRMIAKGTVEEKIIELQKSKLDLAESIISEDQDFMKKMSREDLEMLLS